MSAKKTKYRGSQTPLSTSTPKQRLSFSSAKKSPITVKLPEGSIVRDVASVSLRNTTATADGIDGQTPSKVQDRQTKKELKILQEENKELKAELSYIKSLYTQLVEEASEERFDEQRVNLLKSQVIQLGRQVVLLSSALNARTDMLTEVEGQMIRVRDQLGTFQEAFPSNHVLSEGVADVQQTLEGMRCYLNKTVENTNPNSLHLPAVFMGKFLKRDRWTGAELTLLDSCSGRLDHLNLRHVSKLESKLCKTYKQVLCLKELMTNTNTDSSLTRLHSAASLDSEHIGQPIRDRLSGHVTTTTKLLEESCRDLLSLSVLLPAAPWPPLRKPIRTDLTLDDVMAHMPAGLSRKKEQEIHSVIEALMKAVSYNQHMLALEVRILKEELSFHQKVYNVQVEYAESLLAAIRTAYTQFERSTIEMLCQPLDGILESYEALKSTTSEQALRNFLTQFKNNSEKLSDAVECLQSHAVTNSEGPADTLSQFGQHFMDSLHTLTRECTTKRDLLMTEVLKLRTTSELENTSIKSTENSRETTNVNLNSELNTSTSPQS